MKTIQDDILYLTTCVAVARGARSITARVNTEALAKVLAKLDELATPAAPPEAQRGLDALAQLRNWSHAHQGVTFAAVEVQYVADLVKYTDGLIRALAPPPPDPSVLVWTDLNVGTCIRKGYRCELSFHGQKVRVFVSKDSREVLALETPLYNAKDKALAEAVLDKALALL